MLEAPRDEAGHRLLWASGGGSCRRGGWSGAPAKHPVEGSVAGAARELLLEGLCDLWHTRLGLYAPEGLHQSLAERVLRRDH